MSINNNDHSSNWYNYIIYKICPDRDDRVLKKKHKNPGVSVEEMQLFIALLFDCDEHVGHCSLRHCSRDDLGL